MDYAEEWAPIQEAPIYIVSTYGRIMNTQTETFKKATANQQGIPSVLLLNDGLEFRRSVPLLVARTFLPPAHKASFDTPINLNGDRFDNYIHNLQWRPRWFAVKYHRQYKIPMPTSRKVQLVQTGEIFNTIRECAMQFGLLEMEVLICAMNHEPVFPLWQMFTLVAA